MRRTLLIFSTGGSYLHRPFRFPETQDDSFRHGALQGNVVLVDGLLNGDHGKLGLFLAPTLGILSYSFIHLLFIFDNSHLRM